MESAYKGPCPSGFNFIIIHSHLQFLEPSVSLTSAPLLVWFLLYQVSWEVFFGSLERPHFPKETWPTRSK